MNIHFHTPAGARLSLHSVADELIAYMGEGREREYKVIIGTDSGVVERGKGKHDGMADFVTAIVVHRVGNGGRYFWGRIPYQRMPTLRHRMYQEVLYSLDVAKELVAIFDEKEVLDTSFEIHVDVGENGETSAMISELVSMVRAHNFEARTKPESYAASSVADRHV